ncbi:potassium transporter TrkG, partial [Pseudomonas aeruginosa]
TITDDDSERDFYKREGFVIVTLTWIAFSLIGALPFYLSGEIPSYIDSLFETVSGFTTTGSTILQDIESLS